MAWRFLPGHIFLEAETMYLSAITIGYAVPDGNFDASVHSVFQNAINLCPSGASGLLTLVTASEADLPQGIRVNTPEGFSFERHQVGERVTCQDGNLCLDSLIIKLHGARRWKCNLSTLEVDTTNPAVAIAWNCVWDALNKRQKLSKAEVVADNICHCEEWRESRHDKAISSSLLAQKLHENRGLLRNVRLQRHHSTAWTNVSHKAGVAIRGLVRATRRYDSALAISAVDALVGLGTGLTPCGDDLLVGYMAGLWCAMQDKSERVRFVSDLGKAIIHLSQQTNDISHTYLYHAVHGQVSSQLANLAEAICRGENPNCLLNIAEAAMQVGHTSGMDAVTGLLVGLTAWMSSKITATTGSGI